MKTKLDMNRIARGLGAERRGQVSGKGGYFGALQLLADIQARFRVPSGGGVPPILDGPNGVLCPSRRKPLSGSRSSRPGFGTRAM